MEFKKWCPAFKLLTYYGSAKERKAKRQGWSKPNAFHIAITSYTLILQVRADMILYFSDNDHMVLQHRGRPRMLLLRQAWC